MSVKNILSLGVLIFFAILSLFWVHSYVFNSHLRHGMVEDGSVSQYAGDLLGSSTIIEKYNAVLECDGQANGRYRPGYYVYETLPFFLTLIKNGDYRFGMAGSEIQNKINGDLQFHMIYLLITIGISLCLGAFLIYRVSGSLLYSGLFPLSVILSPTLVRNITYNDTAEVPQLLILATYLVLFFIGELSARQGKKISYLLFLFAMPVAVFLYLIKETAIVLFPAFLLYFILFCGLRFDRSQGWNKRQNIIFSVCHLLLNGLLTVWVLIQVHNLKGGYSGHYDVISFQQLWKTFLVYGKILIRFPPTVYIPLLALGVVILVRMFSKGNRQDEKEQMRYTVAIALCLVTMACGFLFINLPWEFVLERYMLPVAYLSALAGCILVGSLDRWLGKRKRYVVRIMLLIAIIAWSYPPCNKEYARLSLHYEQEYGAYRLVDMLTTDIINDARKKNSRHQVLLEIGKQAPWMWMQVARIVNREGKMNVAVPSQKNPLERLYFRQYDLVPEVILTPSDGGGYFNRPYDVIYSALPFEPNNRDKKKKCLKRINTAYMLNRRMHLQKSGYLPGYEILKFLPTRNPEWEFQHSRTTCLVLNAAENADKIKSLHEIVVQTDRDSILLKSTGEDPFVLLPPFAPVSTHWVVIKVHMWSPVKTKMQLFYKTKEKPFFNEGQSVIKEVKQGDNILYLMLPADVIIGSLRMDPGKKPGLYKLYALEVRAINPI